MATTNTPVHAVILAGFKKLLDRTNLMPAGGEKDAALKRLYCGSIKRSKVVGVDSQVTVEKLISALGEPLHNPVIQKGTSNILYRFMVPQNYQAFTPIARMSELGARGLLKLVEPCAIRTVVNGEVNWVYKFHGPKIYPIKAEVLSFIMNGTQTELVEWYAGEDTTFVQQTADPGTHWVYLSVDLVAENIRKNKQ